MKNEDVKNSEIKDGELEEVNGGILPYASAVRHNCKSCKASFMMDPKAKNKVCPECGSTKVEIRHVFITPF